MGYTLMSKKPKALSYKLNEVYLEGWYSVSYLESLIEQIKSKQTKLNKRDGKA